jgi:acetyltransferase-like isoleucine patch superfamily enzyme
MLDQPLLLEPLLRLMPMPTSLVRHAPVSAERRLRSVRLRDTPLVAGLNVQFDDSCMLTIAEGMEPAKVPLKLSTLGGKKSYTGVHLTSLSAKGLCHVAVGDDHVKLFIGSQAQVRARIHLVRQGTVFIGDRTTTGQSRFVVNNADLVIGEDCQLLDDVLVQCNDAHPMLDLSNGEVINGDRQRVYIGRHVLLNRRVLLMPGVRVGDGSIVQAGAVVVHDVQPNTFVGGAPATLLREQVAWERDFRRTLGRVVARPAAN